MKTKVKNLQNSILFIPKMMRNNNEEKEKRVEEKTILEFLMRGTSLSKGNEKN